MSTRPVFRAPETDRRFESEGFIVLPGIARSAVRPLRQFFRQSVGRVPPGFHSTMYTDDSEVKRRVDREVTRLLLPVIDSVLVGYRPLLANFITKGRGVDGAMTPHQDWTFVDEPTYESMNFWVPLTDVSGRNGALSVLPGSHRVPFTIRGTGTENPFSEIETGLARRMMEVPMSAGDVIVHDHRVVHSSTTNACRRPRIAAACALIPLESRIVHYARGNSGLDRYLVDRDFFTSLTFGAASLPEGILRDATIAFRNPVMAEADLSVSSLSDCGTSDPDVT